MPSATTSAPVNSVACTMRFAGGAKVGMGCCSGCALPGESMVASRRCRAPRSGGGGNSRSRAIARRIAPSAEPATAGWLAMSELVGAQVLGPIRAVAGPALDEHGLLDVVAGARVGPVHLRARRVGLTLDTSVYTPALSWN